MTQHSVVIVGGGPTGLMLAAELAIAGIDVAVVERRASQQLESSRAGGLHARTIEVLDQRGVAERFLSQGQVMQVVRFHMMPLDISDFPARHNYGLALWQKDFERILGAWVDELPVRFYCEREVTGFTQDDAGVDVRLSDGTIVRAEYLVGCDGARSVVRKTAGIDFPGWDATTSWIVAEASTVQEPEWGFRHDARGSHAIAKLDEGRRMRVVLVEPQASTEGEPTVADLREALVSAYGTDFGVHDVTWVSRFSDMARQAASWRAGRVLLAGDAAHVHAPIGGQGLNIGVQDAVNLGWKLAQVVRRLSPDTLLDTYQAERHPVAARVLRNTMAQSALRRPDDQSKALGEFVAEFLANDDERRRIAGEMSGLALHYDLGEGHPLLGRRMPDLDVMTPDGSTRVFTLLHAARPLLLNFDRALALDVAPWVDRVRVVDAEYQGAWQIPVIGTVDAPTAVLVRPDGYVAWVGRRSQEGLTDALTRWFGAGHR